MNMKSDEYFMKRAMQQAQKAFLVNEVPIGAVVVDKDAHIIAQAYNQVEKRHQQSAHAEILAINKACKKIGDWRLNGYCLYVTLQPCAMCMGLIQLSRFSCVIYGAASKLFGYQLDKAGQISLYNKNIEIESGVLAQESEYLLIKFFKEKRKVRDRAKKKRRFE